MKRIIILSILLGAALASHAQGFEWVQTYTGQEVTSGVTTNKIVGSCVDSMGNIYILGEFSPGAFLCGERLLPMDVITTPIQRAVLIAKFSPSGELLWHKAIYNGKVPCYAYALRMVGDSSIMAMVSLYLPYYYGGSIYMNLYYLDTLLTGNDDYLMPTDSVICTDYTAFITLDLDGNEIERHIACVGFIDTNGNALTERFLLGPEHPDQLQARGLTYENFNVDNEGNIIVARTVYMDNWRGGLCDTCEGGYHYWGVDNGTIGAMKIVVDGTHNLLYPIPYRTALRNQQILKFSPHFDSLLDAVYMFDSTLLNRQSGTTKVRSINVDAQNNLYITMQGDNFPGHIGISNSNSLHLGDSIQIAGWMIKYNPDLYAVDVAQLKFEGDGASPKMAINGTFIDDNTNTIFLYGGASWFQRTLTNRILYRNDTLNLTIGSEYWIRLNKDDLSLLSVGTMHRAREGARCLLGALAASNNRVFAHSLYGGAVVGDTVLQPSNFSFGFLVWDYSGRRIMVKTHDCQSSRNGFSQTHIIDSVLYLTGYLYEDATFDTIYIQNYGSSQAYIAKYVDPEFARPYVHPSDRQEQGIEWGQELAFTLADSPVTLNATATSGLPVTYICNDSSIAYVRGDTLHLVAEGYAWLTATQDGDYQYFPADPVQRLLTVGGVGIASVGADGQAKAYPNPTSGKVTIDLGEIPPAPPLPYHKPGPSDSRDVNMVLYTSPDAPFPQYESCGFPYHQRYNMKVSGPKLQSHDGVVTAWLTDPQGRREEVVLTPTGPDQYTLDLTSRPPAAYLLTVTTADGRDLTFRLMKQYGRR